MIFDGASINVKVSRMLLKELSETIEGKLTPIEELNIETSFSHDGSIYFMLFCTIHIIKKSECFV